MQTTTIRAILTGKTEDLKTAQVSATKYVSKHRLFARELYLEWYCETDNYQEALEDVMATCVNPIELEHLGVGLHYIGN